MSQKMIGVSPENFERFAGVRELRDTTSDELLNSIMNAARCPSLEDVRKSLARIAEIKKQETASVEAE